jgi:DNA-binding MarR family transcriptional regulator
MLLRGSTEAAGGRVAPACSFRGHERQLPLACAEGYDGPVMNKLSALHMLLLALLADLGRMTPEELGLLLGIDTESADTLCCDLEDAGMVERSGIVHRRYDRRQ